MNNTNSLITDYRLPNGRIVAIYTEVARGAASINFTLEDGRIAQATRADLWLLLPRIEPCHDCGDPAVAVQASSCDPETGYVDAMALCGPCYAARTGEVDLTPLLDALAREAAE